MKVYKYLQLNTCEYIDRFEKILLNQEIWLSKFSYLNDPMEGIYYTYHEEVLRNLVLSEKNKYLVGSFGSSPDNFLLWAYYADGFRGACIEIETDEVIKPKEVSYIKFKDFKKPLNATFENLELILTRKLNYWEKEGEKRVLIMDDQLNNVTGKLKKIGKITSVFFGNNVDTKVICLLEHLHTNPGFPQNIEWGIYSPERLKDPTMGTFSEILNEIKANQQFRTSLRT